MATEIVMPKLSDTMTEGKLLSWKKAVGDQVVRGDTIAEVETDKATMELEAFSSGTLLETKAKPGDTVSVGTVIAVVGSPDEAGAKGATPEKGGEQKPPAPEPRELPGEPYHPSTAEATEGPEEHNAPPKESAGKGPAGLETAHPGDKASPLVRRLARERGIDLAQVQGSGPEGRIVQEDLERYSQQRKKTEEKVPAQEGKKEAPAPAATGMSRMRSAIARTVSESWRTIPHFSVTTSVEMDAAERLRDDLKKAGLHVTVNDFIVKAASLALLRFPNINASFREDSLEVHPQINIGIAVALDEGLFVPVVRRCENLSLRQIAQTARELVERVRQGKIKEEDLSAGTFTVSNLGMFGVEDFTAVIFPPQGAILAVGGIHEKPVIHQGQVVAARLMQVTLSADHRLVDGAYAARFLAELKNILEAPAALFV